MNLNHRDYRRIAQAIAYLRARHLEQPDLQTLAAQSGLSPAHFQRLFRRWAGISPKQFLAQLTLEQARARLRAGEALMNAAWDSGLSGSGRLHDLFIRLEAMTPGEYAREGQGLRIRHAVSDTPFGPAWVMETDKGICALEFLDEGGEDEALQRAHARWPQAQIGKDTGTLATRIGQAFTGELQDGLRLFVRGSDLQIHVWKALLRIPGGYAVSYGALAKHLGRPNAARAVGTAVGANPIAWLIPCHRVLRGDGQWGGYHWDIERKLMMLGYEAGCEEFAANVDIGTHPAATM